MANALSLHLEYVLVNAISYLDSTAAANAHSNKQRSSGPYLSEPLELTEVVGTSKLVYSGPSSTSNLIERALLP